MNKIFLLSLLSLVAVAGCIQPATIMAESTAGNAGTCTISNNVMTCQASNRGFNPSVDSSSITIQNANWYANSKGLSYNKCKVLSATVIIKSDTGGSRTVQPSDLNTEYDATGDSCPVHFTEWVVNPALESQASITATVQFYQSSTTSVTVESGQSTETETVPVEINSCTNILCQISKFLSDLFSGKLFKGG